MKRRVFSIIFLMLLSIYIGSATIKAAPPEDFNFNASVNLFWTDQEAISKDGEFHLVTDEFDGMPYSIPMIADFSLTAIVDEIVAFNSVDAIYPGHSEAYAYLIFIVDLEELHFYNYKLQLKKTVPFDELVSVTTDDPMIVDNTVSIQYIVDNEQYDLQIVNKGSQLILPEEPEKENHVFVGWYNDPMFYYAYDPLTVVVNGFQLYAKFQLENLNVNFYNGDSLYIVKEATYGNSLESLPSNPVSNNYYKEVYSGKFFDGELNGASRILKLNDLEWIKKSTSGIGAKGLNFSSTDSLISLERVSFRKLILGFESNQTSGYATDISIYISKDNTTWIYIGSMYNGNKSVKRETVNNNYKGLYYIKIATSDNNKSSGYLYDIKLESNHEFDLEKKFVFDGWFYDEELTVPFKETDVFTADINLYSAWKEKEYTLSFNSNLGSPVTSQFYYEDDEIVLPEYNPSRIGYVFDGWYLDEELEQEFNLETMPGDDVVLYAKWEEITEPEVIQHLIEFYLGEELYTYIALIDGDQLILPTAPPTAENQIFLGWFYDEEFTEQFKVTDLIEDDVTLYGKFGSSGSGGTETPPEETPGTEFKLEKKYVIIAAIVFVGIGLALIIRKRK